MGVPFRPRPGDLLVRYEHESDRYFIIDAVTRIPLQGPFLRLDFAVGVANSLAYKGGGCVYRESINQQGVVFESPELVTPRQRRFSSTADHQRPEDEDEQPQ